MQITLNGEAHTVPDACSLPDLLAEMGLQDKRIAVERNGEIIPRSQHAQQLLEADDVLEIVQAIGGG